MPVTGGVILGGAALGAGALYLATRGGPGKAFLERGSIVTIEASGSLGILSVGDIRPQISAIIRESPLNVNSFTLTTESAWNAITGGTLGYDFNARLTIQTAIDYGKADDVRSIVDNAFYRAIGALPASSRVKQFVTPSGQIVKTGEDADAKDQDVNTEGPLDALAKTFNVAASTVKWILVGLFALVVLVVLLVGYAPNVGTLARHV